MILSIYLYETRSFFHKNLLKHDYMLVQSIASFFVKNRLAVLELYMIEQNDLPVY